MVKAVRNEPRNSVSANRSRPVRAGQVFCGIGNDQLLDVRKRCSGLRIDSDALLRECIEDALRRHVEHFVGDGYVLDPAPPARHVARKLARFYEHALRFVA